ncbi:hypothetical protein VNO77_13875 [Canavalia gladiata]|uniref:DUF7046 domain-containing protein n=1 Tax=Canavalia gladiata TaxID=3824 RepID=A0AAN9QQR0_CANGL
MAVACETSIVGMEVNESKEIRDLSLLLLLLICTISDVLGRDVVPLKLLDNSKCIPLVSLLPSFLRRQMLAGYLDIREPATLAIKKEGYSIKCRGPNGVVITEKFSPSTTV